MASSCPTAQLASGGVYEPHTNNRWRENAHMSPETRRRLAWTLLTASLIGWPATHVAMLITKPADASSWVFHVLLAISWLAITLTALDILQTTDVRVQQEDDGGAST